MKTFFLLKDPYILYTLFFTALLLLRVPFLGKFFRSVNTMIHESGHAVTALLTSGSVMTIDISSDASGAAKTKSKTRFGQILTSFAGYVFSSSIAYCMCYFIWSGKYTWALYFLTGLAIINLIFWVRNTYGIIWLLLFLGLSGYLVYIKIPLYTKIFTIFLSSVIFLESIFTSVIICLLSFYNPEKAGDAKNLKEFTYIPVFVWGLIFLSQALFFAYLSIKLFFKLPF